MAIANIDTTFSAPRRRNVTPKSSILQVYTKDIDCSGMTKKPEDGEFVIVAGTTGTTANIANITAANGTPASTDAQGAGLRMVWGSAQRADRTASGDKRVPVFHGGSVEVECKLFNHDADESLDAVANFKPGQLCGVFPNKSTIAGGGATTRLVLTPMIDGELGWAVGVVIATSRKGAVAQAGDSVTVRLFDAPHKIGTF